MGCRVHVCKRVHAVGTVCTRSCVLGSASHPVHCLFRCCWLHPLWAHGGPPTTAVCRQHPINTPLHLAGSAVGCSSVTPQHTPHSFYALVVIAPHVCSYALQRLWQAHACLAVGALVVVLYYYALCRTKLCPDKLHNERSDSNLYDACVVFGGVCVLGCLGTDVE